jgi:hypothetical protein
MTTTEITLIGIFTIEAIRLIMAIVKEMKQDEKIPFSNRLKDKKDFYV